MPRDGKVVTKVQQRLVHALAAQSGSMIPHRELISIGWPGRVHVDRACLHQQIFKLRRAVAPLRIESEYGMGYILLPP